VLVPPARFVAEGHGGMADVGQLDSAVHQRNRSNVVLAETLSRLVKADSGTAMILVLLAVTAYG
jgi:hypothetical protein